MSAHADKTLHRKIYNINDTDAHMNSCTNSVFVYEFRCEFVKEVFTNFVHEFINEIRMNSYEFVRICMIFCMTNWLCYEWPVL